MMKKRLALVLAASGALGSLGIGLPAAHAASPAVCTATQGVPCDFDATDGIEQGYFSTSSRFTIFDNTTNTLTVNGTAPDSVGVHWTIGDSYTVTVNDANTVVTAGTFLAVPRTRLFTHGCIAATNNYSLGADGYSPSLVARVNGDNTPCTFVFAAGDTYSGSGKFTISCETGGKVTHPDFENGSHPPVVDIPIPQPCAVGATVTVDGGRFGTGGSVLAGGAGPVPAR
jgi:hypothetical protein